ncbi:hypothetical protein GGU10DRAFT_381471 [Lentinula aff. detonsa]|uniref:Uncharacterized protein n=1 Tax=Lentinula aff. detonsa TaxID=2804958 RepID=A0AA38NIL1_9AGAR|nr:hypothetical protein GGU10DRAFT_381471 [Lentinula aff. detonsa]
MSERYTETEVLKTVHDLGREVVLRALGISALSHARDATPASPAALDGIFDTQLDISGETLTQMEKSTWNQTLVLKLAHHAEDLVQHCREPEKYGHPVYVIEWDLVIRAKINSALKVISKGRNLDLPAASLLVKRLRAVRAWKAKCRLSIAASEQQTCRKTGDAEGDSSWGFVVFLVDVLRQEGMSDEEDGEEDGEAVRVVLDVDYRRHELRTLFELVDTVQGNNAKGQGGRKFKKRIRISKESKQLPAEGVPRVLLSPAFRSNTPWTSNEHKLEAQLQRYNSLLALDVY